MPIPRPLPVTGERLLEWLALTSNAKLRREFGKCLAEVAGPAWPQPSHLDAGWGEALATFLSSHEAYRLFLRAAERHHGGPLQGERRLNLAAGVLNDLAGALKKARLPRAAPFALTTVKSLLEAGCVEEAAVLAWLLWMSDPGNDGPVRTLLQDSADLAAYFGVGPADGRTDVAALRALAARVADADDLDADVLEQLSRMAGDVAMRLRAEATRNAKRRADLLARLAGSPLGLAAVAAMPACVSPDAVELALDRAEAAHAEFAGLREALRAAAENADFGLAERLGKDGLATQARLTEARATLEGLMRDAGAAIAGEPEAPLQETARTPAPAPLEPGDGPTEEAGRDAGPAEGTAAGDRVAEEPVGAGADEEAGVQAAPQPVDAPPVSPDPSGTAEAARAMAPAPPDTEAQAGTGVHDGPVAGPPQEGRAPETDRRMFLAALAQGRLGLAEALMETAPDDPAGRILVAAIRLAAQMMVADGNGTVDEAARLEAGRVAEEWQAEGLDGEAVTITQILTIPAASALALLAPGSEQPALLSQLLVTPGADEDREAVSLRALRQLGSVVERAASTLGPAFAGGSALLAALVRHEEWQAELDAFAADTRGWCQQQVSRTLKYPAATDVWHELLRADDGFGAPLRSIVHGELDRAAATRAFIASLDIPALIRRFEPRVRGAMSARRAPIQAQPWSQLQQLSHGVVARLREWLALLDRQPSDIEARAGEFAELRRQLRDAVGRAREEVAGLAGAAATAVPVAVRAFDRLDSLLGGDTPQPEADSVDRLLAADLLPVPTIAFGTEAQRERPLAVSMRGALARLVAHPAGLLDAARARLEHGDFVGADLALAGVADAEAAQAVRALLHDAVEQARARARGETDAALAEVEIAESTGRLEAGVAAELGEEMRRRREGLDEAQLPEFAEVLGEVLRYIERARQRLTEAKGKIRDRVTLRIDRLGRGLDAPTRARIEALLAQEQFALAEDTVERAEAGEPPMTDAATSELPDLDAFFPEQADRIAGWLRGHPAAMRGLAEGTLSLPEALGGEGRPPEPEIQALARVWADCARSRGNHLRPVLEELMRGFGFTDPSLVSFQAPGKTQSEAQFQLTTRPLLDRASAVLPAFGSGANGTYDLLCLWQRRDVEEIPQALARSRQRGVPTIVLFFGILDAAQRRRLAVLARRPQGLSAIVVDETLALSLALVGQGRLFALFERTLPFTDLRPWSDTAPPPPEMFFGRARELRAVEAREGEVAHLLYGGRQLGKTALLRQVEMAAAGQADKVVRYVGIARIGVQQPVTELWGMLADELRQAGLPHLPVAGRDPGRGFAEGVRRWLDERPERRILLLLDEADAFFTEDRKVGYAVTLPLRDLTTVTNRRFKPVFAGLHNVQKLLRDPNSPIAHLGQPLAVGPLIHGGERAAAEELVRWPFTALGYRLEDAAVTRILAFANYYPSLIQVVCQRLLNQLRGQQGGGGPPWTVRVDAIERVLDQPELRQAAFQRFRITLELDQRYKLLTLLAAELSQDDPVTLASGLDRAELRQLAALAWPAGFDAGSGEDTFDALLDEMVGLGLLRAASGTHYALRSGNLAHLIGTPAEIDRQIAAFADQPAPAEVDPLESRRPIGPGPGPLASRQEAVLLEHTGGSAVIGGLWGGRIGDCAEALKGAVNDMRHRFGYAAKLVAPRALDVAGLARHLQDMSRCPAADGLQVLILGPEINWTADWVRQAQETLAVTARLRAPARVVFVADAMRAWHWVRDPGRAALLDGTSARDHTAELTVGTMGRSALDLWLREDNELGMTVDEVLARTGGWPALVARLRTSPERPLRDGNMGDLGHLLAAHPQIGTVMQGLIDAQSLRQDGDIVDMDFLMTLLPETVERSLADAVVAWGAFVGLVSRTAHGLALVPFAVELLCPPAPPVAP